MGIVETTTKVLIVDDEPLIRNSLFRGLAGRAIVKAVTSDEEALEEIGAYFYDLCLIDFFLTGMDGLDTMRKIYEISPETKVAIMTGSYLTDDMKQQVNTGAFDFLEKPFSISRLRGLLQKLIIISGDHPQEAN